MRARDIFRHLAVFPLVVYRKLFSPLTPASCIYRPTCSAYAQAAILRHGVLAGMLLAAARVGRCVATFFDGGDDPVPEVFTLGAVTEGYRRFHRRRRPGRERSLGGRIGPDGGSAPE